MRMMMRRRGKRREKKEKMTRKIKRSTSTAAADRNEALVNELRGPLQHDIGAASAPTGRVKAVIALKVNLTAIFRTNITTRSNPTRHARVA